MQTVMIHLKSGRSSQYGNVNKVKTGKYWAEIHYVLRNINRIDYIRATEITKIEASGCNRKPKGEADG